MMSLSKNIENILNTVRTVNPAKILDVGTGFGKFSILIREMILSERAEKGDLLPKDDLIIDCVEEAKYFHNLPYHDKLYNNHFHKDVMDIPIDILNSYDLILLIDVVEHWDKEIAKEWLKKIKTRIIISTPKRVHMFKERYYDARNHISQWDIDDFKGIDYSTEKSYIFLEN